MSLHHTRPIATTTHHIPHTHTPNCPISSAALVSHSRPLASLAGKPRCPCRLRWRGWKATSRRNLRVPSWCYKRGGWASSGDDSSCCESWAQASPRSRVLGMVLLLVLPPTPTPRGWSSRAQSRAAPRGAPRLRSGGRPPGSPAACDRLPRPRPRPSRPPQPLPHTRRRSRRGRRGKRGMGGTTTTRGGATTPTGGATTTKMGGATTTIGARRRPRPRRLRPRAASEATFARGAFARCLFAILRLACAHTMYKVDTSMCVFTFERFILNALPFETLCTRNPESS